MLNFIDKLNRYNYSGLYYTFNIIFVSISIGASIIVLRIHFRGHKSQMLYNTVKKLLRIKSIINTAILSDIERYPYLLAKEARYNRNYSAKILSKRDFSVDIKANRNISNEKSFQNLAKILRSLQYSTNLSRKEKKDYAFKENILKECKLLK